MKDLDAGATKAEVVSDNRSRAEELVDMIDAEVNYCKEVLVIRVVPLEKVISTKEKRWMGVSLIKSGEGKVVRSVN